MTRFAAAVVSLMLAFTAGCHEAQKATQSQDTPAGALSYRSYDGSGALVATGWMQLDIAVAEDGAPVPSEFSGTWELHALADPARIGPQDGSGALVGTFTENGVVVELQPGQADNDVALHGTLTFGGPARMRYEGEWRWMTFTGERAHGTFIATE